MSIPLLSDAPARDGCRMVYLSEKPPEQPELLAGYPDLLTVAHLVEITGLSAQTIRREINTGGIPGRHIGRRLFVPKTEFVGYLRGGLDG